MVQVVADPCHLWGGGFCLETVESLSEILSGKPLPPQGEADSWPFSSLLGRTWENISEQQVVSLTPC